MTPYETGASPTGHRSIPHTADVIIEAWAPDLEGCLVEACRALLGEFIEADVVAEAVDRPFRLEAPDGPRLLAALLEEVIFVVDAEALVPRVVSVDRVTTSPTGYGCVGTLRVVPLAACRQVGSAPKSVSLSGLELSAAASGWVARAVIDI